jgi:hypothetical protein
MSEPNFHHAIATATAVQGGTIRTDPATDGMVVTEWVGLERWEAGIVRMSCRMVVRA